MNMEKMSGQKKFQIKDLGEYSDLYLKVDFMLLAEVFEEFRTNCLNTYELDCAHYYTTSGFSWDAMLQDRSMKNYWLHYMIRKNM